MTVPVSAGNVMVLSAPVALAAVRIVSIPSMLVPWKYSVLPPPSTLNGTELVESPTPVVVPVPPMVTVATPPTIPAPKLSFGITSFTTNPAGAPSASSASTPMLR
jgi:hypothetical protein